MGLLRISPKERLVLTAPFDQELLNTLLAALQWQDGDPDTLKSGATTIIASGQATVLLFQPPINPPNVMEEWILYAISVRDSTGTDAADFVQINYVDAVTTTSLQIHGSAGTTNIGTSGSLFAWPGKLTAGASPSVRQPLPTRLRENGEPWRQVQVVYTATATVGSRSVIVTAFFRRRNL